MNIVLTSAMRQGHNIHKKLERELHETVRVTHITTAEELWALKFLNILFGLRELELHGMTVSSTASKLMTERISCVWMHRKPLNYRYNRPNRL